MCINKRTKSSVRQDILNVEAMVFLLLSPFLNDASSTTFIRISTFTEKQLVIEKNITSF